MVAMHVREPARRASQSERGSWRVARLTRRRRCCGCVHARGSAEGSQFLRRLGQHHLDGLRREEPTLDPLLESIAQLDQVLHELDVRRVERLKAVRTAHVVHLVLTVGTEHGPPPVRASPNDNLQGGWGPQPALYIHVKT